MDDANLKQLLDACRPGSTDLDDPQMAPLAEHLAAHPVDVALQQRLERLDASIRQAAQAVPVPEGLQERLLAGLQATLVAHEALPTAKEPDSETTPAPEHRPRPAGRGRRAWTLGVLTTAAAACLAVAYFGGWFSTSPLHTESTLAANARSFFDSEQPGESTVYDRNHRPPLGMSQWVRAYPGTKWRKVPDFLGQRSVNAVAFDIPFGGATATLYVSAMPVEFNRTNVTPTSLLPSTTGGRAVATWLENNLVYVLVVRGSESDLKQFIVQPRGVV